MPKYPFTPELLDALPEELAELFRGLELTLLEEICSRLKIADNLNEVTVQDIRALRAMGIDLEDIKKAVAGATGTGTDKLNVLLDDVVSRNQAYYTEMVDLAQVTSPERLVDAQDIDAIRRQTVGEYANITQSMGFIVHQGGKQVLLPPAKACQHCLDSAELQVMSGAVSYNQAIASAVKELAESGLCVAYDKNGNPLKNRVAYESEHIDHLDVAVRRAVMTGVNQLNQKYREQSMDYLETDLVEVTAHSGARDKDGPMGWENHKKWQGKVYRWSAKPRASKGRYPDFKKTCGYGSVTGIGGANCRHSYWPYIEGVSERTYTDKELANIDPPPITFEGRAYSAYEATQLQRRVEREIRKQRRLKTAYEAAGLTEDAQAANIRLRRLNQKYKSFSEAAGLPEQRERMRVQYVDDLSAAESDIGDFARRTAKSITHGQKVVGFTGLPKEMQQSFREGITRAAPETKAVLRQIYRQTDYVVSGGTRSYYSNGFAKNIVHIGTSASPSTLAHELFHKLDSGHRISSAFAESLTKDYMALNMVSGGGIKEYLLQEYPSAFVFDTLRGEYRFGERFRGISDILSGLTNGIIQFGFGHRAEYWKEPGALEAEAWAQFGRIQFENDAEVLEMMKKIFPYFYESAIIALKGLV